MNFQEKVILIGTALYIVSILTSFLLGLAAGLPKAGGPWGAEPKERPRARGRWH